jgi:hypothetical protein
VKKLERDSRRVGLGALDGFCLLARESFCVDVGLIGQEDGEDCPSSVRGGGGIYLDLATVAADDFLGYPE